MKKPASMIITAFLLNSAIAQTPFGISNRVVLDNSATAIQSRLERKLAEEKQLKPYEVSFLSGLNMFLDKDANEELKLYNKLKVEEAEKPDVADKLSTGIVVNGEFDKLFPTLVGDIITYRLNLWTRTIKHGPDKGKKALVYLPLSIVSKISGSNEDNSGTVNDAVSYFGAPLTFRLSPNLLDVPTKDGMSRFVVGMHHDFRVLPIGDTLTDKVDIGVGYYGAFGCTFFGKGSVKEDESETWIEGKWSFSALVYTFISGGKFKKAVFGDYDQKSLSGFEMMLRFKTNADKDKKFNLFLGANYGLTKNSPNQNKWDFRIGIGN